MTQAPNVTTIFLEGARTVVEAISDPVVAKAWDRPSVLEDQKVSGLAGHLARGGVWAVADYLGVEAPSGPVDFESAGEYFAVFAASAGPDDQRAIRERGAAVAAVGRDELLVTLRERLEALGPGLNGLPPDHLVSVIGGRVMRLSDYLTTRVVEQAVHLDDFARSVGHTPWRLPDEHKDLAIAVGVDIANRLHGHDAMIRALYRRGFAEQTLPVL